MRNKHNILLKINLLLVVFVLLELEIYAQVAAPSLLSVRPQTNPATIYWKNKGIYIGYARIAGESKVEFLQEGKSDENYKDKHDRNEAVMGANLEGIAFEVNHSEGIDTSETSQEKRERKSAQTFLQAALGSDVVSFGYTNVGTGSDKELQVRRSTSYNGCCYNSKTFTRKYDTVEQRQSDEKNNSYGFSLRFRDFYAGWVRNTKEEKNKQNIRKGSYTDYTQDGETYNYDLDEVQKYEDITHHNSSFGIAYYVNNPTGGAFHFEISKNIQEEKKVDARNTDYQASTQDPRTQDSILIEGRLGAYVLMYERITQKPLKASWESDENFNPVIFYWNFISLGLQLEGFDIYIIRFEGNAQAEYQGVPMVKWKQTQNGLGFTFKM